MFLIRNGILVFSIVLSLCFAKTPERQLVDFKPIQAPWLEQYPIIQAEVKKIIENHKKDITKGAEELFQEFPHSVLLPYKLHIKEVKLFKPHNQDIVSVRMAIYTYTGGAHGGTSYYSWNWSKTKQKFLSLDEVIQPNQFELLVKQARQILFRKQKQNDKTDKQRKAYIQSGTSKKEDFEIWNLDRKGIVFTFPEYQVASYVAGSFEIYIPLDSLQ